MWTIPCMLSQMPREESQTGRPHTDGRPPLPDSSLRFDRGRSTDDARRSADRGSRSSGEGRNSEDRPGEPALERRHSLTLAAIAAAAEAGAAAKGRSPAVTPPSRSPHLTPTTSTTAAGDFIPFLHSYTTIFALVWCRSPAQVMKV